MTLRERGRTRRIHVRLAGVARVAARVILPERGTDQPLGRPHAALVADDERGIDRDVDQTLPELPQPRIHLVVSAHARRLDQCSRRINGGEPSSGVGVPSEVDPDVHHHNRPEKARACSAENRLFAWSRPAVQASSIC